MQKSRYYQRLLYESIIILDAFQWLSKTIMLPNPLHYSSHQLVYSVQAQ